MNQLTRASALILAIALGAVLWALPRSAVAADVPPSVDLPCLPVLSSLAPACPSPSKTPAQTAPDSRDTPSSTGGAKAFTVAAAPDLARALVAEVNRTRRAHGRRVLVYSKSLAGAADAHALSLAQAGEFTHAWPATDRPFGRWIIDFYPARGYRAWSAGENLLWASPGIAPGAAVLDWFNSPAHRRVMLARSWREIGIGVVTATAAPGAYGGRDVQIAAAEFGRRRP
jgi:uncharacterized protein YkwD